MSRTLVFVLCALALGCKKKRDDRAPVQLALGALHSCALMKDGSVRCWGGAAGPTPVSVPTRVDGRWRFRQVATGFAHTCASVGDASHPSAAVVCWGRNDAGRVGDPASEDRPPHQLDVDAVDLAAGGDTTCARVLGKTVTCWGGLAGSHVPTPVKNLTNVAQIAVGKNHACARLDDGTARCWGKNDRGQLGDTTRTDREAPVPVVRLTNITRIAAGDAHTCARVGEERVECWGANGAGQLGDGTTNDRSTPADATRITGAVQLSLGGDTSCARMQDASVMCWGDNSHHQVADGTTNMRLEPVLVFGVFDVVEVGTGSAHVCVRFKDPRVRCWGANGSGQLGDGTTMERAVPVGVKF